jgi:hypothetical protein
MLEIAVLHGNYNDASHLDILLQCTKSTFTFPLLHLITATHLGADAITHSPL